MAKRFQKYSVGGILRVPLGGNIYTYGQMVGDATIAFFDAKTTTDLPVSEIITKPVLFRVAVDRYAVSKFIWLKIGKADLSKELRDPEPQFIQDPLNPEHFEIYLAGEIRPATKDECKGLERCAVWSPEQVVDRINDFYEGKPCRWLPDLV